MLRIAVNWAGRRIAAVFALLYLAGVIAPSAGLAFSNGAMSAYCFDQIVEQVGSVKAQTQVQVHVHVHADGTVHVHADHGKPTGSDEAKQDKGKPSHDQHDANCCGAFGLAAVLPQLNEVARELRLLVAQPPMASDYMAGCEPARIDRPPILI
jgi:hypothetical protein